MCLSGCEDFSSTVDSEGFLVRLVGPDSGLLPPSGSPGVFGVLRELPKVANAPLPRPNAEDAEVGEGMASGDAVLKGLKCRLPCELVSPPRDLVADGGPNILDAGAFSPDMDRESLPELPQSVSSSVCGEGCRGGLYAL